MPVLVQAAASVVLAAGVFSAALYLFANHANGTFGFSSTFLSGRGALLVNTVVQGGPANRSGIRAGDVLSPPSATLVDRSVLSLFGNPPIVVAGDAAPVVRERHGTRSPVTLIAGYNTETPRFEALFFALVSLPMLALGWFIVWRKPSDGDAIVLGFMLQSFGLAMAIPDRVGPPLARLFFYEIFSSALFIFGVYCAALFFARYREGSGIARFIRRLSLYAASALTVIELLLMAATYLLPLFVGDVSILTVPTIIAVVGVPLLAFICFIDAFRSGNDVDRARLRWIGGSFFIGFSGPVFLPGAILILGSTYDVTDQLIFSSTFYVLAFGLTYAILKRRVVDVSFVINRALVFSAVSACVVGAFIALEWIAGTLFVNLSRATSLVIEAAIALVIGFSLRPLHDRTDRFVDRIFFAKRHAAEKALRQLAVEINFIRNREAVVARVQRDLVRYLEVTSIALYYRDDVEGDFAQIADAPEAPEFLDADDNAAVAMTVEEAPVHLDERDTRLRGEVAIPLAVRKVLVGALVLGHKRSGEAFAPDEMDSLRFLAGYLGAALAALSATLESTSTQSLLRELLIETREQRAQIQSLTQRLLALIEMRNAERP